MLEREKALRPAVERLELLLQKANKIQNMAVDCEEKLTLAKNTLQADMSQLENGQPVRCENELGMYLQDCEALIRQLHLDLQVLRDEKYYQVEQLAFRVSCLQEELVSLRLHCASVYRKGHFSTGGLLGEHAIQKGSSGGLATLGAQTLLGAVGAAASLLRRPMSRADLVAMSSSEDEGSLRFIYELLGWVEETQDLLLRAEWGSDLPSVEQHLQDHHIIHKAVEDLLNSLKEARNYESRVSPNLLSSYSETLSKLENQYCKLLEHSSWRLRCLESLRTFVSHCTEELIWLNEREEEELAFDWSDSNTNMAAKREQYADMRSELEVKQEVMRSLQETADHLCQENHPAKQTVEAYSAALQTQWQWIKELCICVEQHLKDNTAYFQFTSDARDCESYLRQLQDTIKRQYTCDKNSRLGRLEDLLQDSMEEKEQLIEYRSTVASLVGRAKSVVQLRPRSADSNLGTTTPIRTICDYRQIEITISKGEECVLEDNSQRTKWKVISSTGNEAMVPSVCFTIPPPNQEAIDTASRMEQMYQNVMSLWHQLHVNMKSVVSWHYLHKDIRNIASWSLDTMRLQAPAERQQALDNLEAHLSDFLTDSRESSLFTPTERRELEREAENCREHCQTLLVSLETVEKDELASRAYLSELQSIKSHLEDAESRLMRGMQTPHPSTISGDVADNAVHIAEQEKLQQDLKGLQSDLGEVSRRCVSFFEEKPSSSSVPVLRSELNLAVEHIEKLNSLSSVYLQKLKTVDVLMRSLQAAESQVKKYESRLSEEDIVPADTAAIQALGEQLNKWHSELEEQNNIFESLSLEVQQAREVGNQLNQLHPDRSPELDRYQEKAQQLTERWSGVRRQLETRQADLEMLGSVLQQYKEGHSSLIRWIEETTEKQENTQPEQTDSRALSEQLAQQTALVAEIEQNQVKLDECQTHSKQYCAAVKDYELQLMTFRAFVESTQKSPVKRRRMHSSSDVITQEFMDLRTRYTALVTLTTQHVKYINDALRRLEEEEKELEEERQARVGQVSELLGWVKGLQERAGRSAEPSLAAQHAISEQLAAKKEEVAEAIRSTQVFLMSKRASKLSPEERTQVVSQLDELTATYTQLCDSSAAQLQQLEEQLAKEEKRKGQEIIAGVIDLGTMETFPIFQAAQHGLIDQDTCHVLLEAQVVMGGLFQPDSPDKLSLDKSLSSGLIDKHTYQSLEELEHALGLVNTVKFAEGQDLPVAIAMKEGVIKELVGLRILELQISTGSLKSGSSGEMVSLDNAREKGLLSPDLCQKLQSCLHRRELIDPNTAEKLSLVDFQQRCVLNQEKGLRLFPVKQKQGGTVCLCSGRKVGIFRAVQEGLIDRHVTVRLLEAQLFAGGITDPRSGHRLTVNEAVRHGLMDQDLACTLMTRQLETGGIIDPVSGERLELDEAIKRDLLSPRIALRVLESLQSFMAIMWPESGELLPVSEALQQGVVNRELAAKALRKRHSVGAVYLPESGQVVPLHQAEKILKPQAVEILKHIQVQDVLPHVSPSSSLYMKRLSSGSAYSSSPPASHADINYDFSITEEGRSDEQVQNHLLSQVMTHSYINAHSGERLVLLEPELVELICRDIKTANLARPVQLQISDNVRVMLDSKAMSGTEEEKNEELKISQHEIACRDSYMEETVEMAGEDLAPLMVTNRTLKEPLHKVVLQEKVLSSEEYEQPKIKGKIDCKITDIGEAVERTEDLAPLTKTNITELSNEEIQQEKVLSSRDYVEPKIKKDEIGGSNINVGESIGLAEQDVPHLASKDRPFIVRSHKENLQEKVLSPGIHEKPKFLKGKIAWTNTDIGETVERAEEDLAPLTGTAGDLIVPLHKENLQEKVLSSGQYKEPKIKKDETSSKETNIGEKKERPEEDVAALTGSEITFIEPTHEVVSQEKVQSSGEYEEPIIIKGKIAYKITGMGEMIERAEEDVAPLTDAGRAFVEPLNKDNLQEKVLSSGQPKIKKDETSSKETNIGETKEKPEEDVAALTGSEITFIEPTREVVWQEKVLSSGKFEEPMIMKGKIAYKITGMGEMIERAEGDLAPLTGTEETFMEPLHRVYQEKVLSSGECDESTILKGKVNGKNADVREKIDREEKDLAPLTGKEGTFMEPSREVWQEKILSGECDEPEIKKDEIDWKNTEIGETKVKAEEDLPLLAVSERTFMEPSQEDYWQKDVVSLGQYEEPKIDISKIASKKTDMGETIERTEEYLAPSTGKGLNLTVPFQTSSTLPKTKSDNGAPSQNQIIDSTLNESENKQTLDLEQADNSGVFLKISEQKGESSARTSHQDTVNVRQYDQLNVNPDDAKTAKQSDEPKKIVEHKENKRIFEQPGKDKKLYPLEIKTLSVELSDDDVKLESMALELQQRGLVTVGGQKVLLDEAVAQGLLPGHTAIKLMEKAGLFGGFLDINACKSLSVEDVMQEGLLDEDLMACVLHSEKILAGVIDVEHGRHCSIRDAAEAGLLDSDTAARLLEAQVVSGGIVDLRRDKKLSVTLAANFGLIEEGRKEKLLALEKSCRGKCSDPNAVQTKLALQLQMKGVVDPKTKNAVPLEQALQTGLIGQNEAQTILCQQVAEGGIVHPGSGVRLAVVDALQLGLIDHTVAPKLMELEKEFKGQEPRSLDQNTSLLQASTGSIYDDASKSRITLSEAVSKGLLAAETANKAMDSSNVKSGLLDPHKACIVSYSELINQGKIDIEKRQRFLEVRPFRGVPHKQTDEMMTLPQAIKTGQIDPIPAVRVLQSQADTGGIINIYTGERLPLPEAINKGLVDKDMAKCIATNQLLKGGLLNPASGQKVSSITEAIEYGLISTEMAAELQHSMGLVDEHEKKSSKISASSMKATSSSFVPEMISEHVSPNKMSLEKGLLSIPSPPSSYLTEAEIKDPDLRKKEELESFDIRPDLESKEEFVDAVIQDSNDTSLKVLTEFTLKAEKRLQEAIEEIKPTESEHIKSQPIQIPEQPEEMSDFKWQKLEVENSTALLDHTTEMEIKRHTVNVSAFTTAILSESSDNSKEQVPSTEQTTGETEIQRQTVSEPAISEVSFSDTDDGLQNKEQTPSIEQIEGHSFKLEKDQSKPEKIKDSQETGLDPYASTTTRPVKVSGKKKGRGKNGKQAKMESDVKLQVSETSARISPIEKAEVDGQDGFTTNQKRIMKDDKEKLVAVQQSETTHGSGSTAPLTGSDETVQGRDLEIGDDRTENETKTPKCDTDHETNEKQKEKTQKSVTTYMAKTDQSQEAVVVSKDLGTEVSEKKRKKKSKSKKVKQVCIVETEGVEKIDDETEKEHKMVIHEVQPQSNQSDEKESMKQLEKASQAMAQKEILLMKAKESILRKVFERGVSEKQAAEELEAMRQVASIGEYRITTQEETVVEKTSTKPPQSKKKDNKLHQTGQEINERVERSVPNIAENPLPGSDIDPCSSAKAQLQKPEEDQHDKHTNTGLSGDDMNQNIPSMKTSDDTVDINQKELVLIQNLEDPVIEVTLPSSTAVTDSREIAKSVPLKCVFDIPVMKDSKALLSSEVCTPLQNTKTAVKEASSEVHQERTKEPPFSDYEATDELSIQKVSGLPLMEVISESDTKQKEKVEEYAEALVERQAGAIQMSTEQKSKDTTRASKSSLARQECLEHDQQIVALLSMVRHIEVRLKQQQQQQSIGRSLSTLDDIIKQTEMLFLEISDLEPEVHKKTEAATQLLESSPQDVPPQLLIALEKDGRSLARAYSAARDLAQNTLQGLREQCDAQNEAVSSQLKSLQEQVDKLLSWLKDTEMQMQEETGVDGQTVAEITRKQQLCKMLQNSLSARSSEVSNVAFNIQVFISEHAQDLLPDQSRHLLGQLEQLQRVFHQAVGLNHARAEALSAQQARENERMMKEQKEKEEKMEKEKQTTRDREVVQQQKAECSQKLENLTMWLAGAASLLASQRVGTESDDVNELQQKQRELKEVEKDLQTKSDQLTETIRSVEEFLSDRGDSLSPEERAKLQGTLSQMKEQHSSLTNSVRSSLAKVDTAIVTTVQQNTQKAKAEEQMQETQEKIDTLLRELSSLDDSKRRSLGYTVTDTPSSGPPENALNSHSDMLQTELQQLQAQQAHLQQVAQSVHSLLEQPDSSVPPEEKQRLRAKLEQLQSQHQERLQNCQDRLRRTDALRDEFAKFVQEHGNLGTWLDQSEQELRTLGEGETDAKGLKDRIEEHKKLAEDVICHKADLRFVTISGQKVLDSIQGALEKVGSTDPALEETRHLVSGKLQDATQRYSSLHSKSSELGTRLSGLLERFQHYQDEAGSLGSWLSTQEQNQSVFKPSGEQTDTQTLQHTLSTVQLLQDELAERSVQLEKVKRAGNELVNTQESPTLKNADINNLTDTLEKRFETLSNSVSVRAEQLQTAVAQSVSVQEGLKALLAWLDGLPLSPGAVQPTAQAVQDALTQNQKLRQELLSRQGSVDATLDSVSKLLKSADASTASGLQGALQDLSQRYTAAQAKQTTRETELRGLLPKLESFERQSADLRSFTQSRERALSPVGQPDCSVDDYKQTIEEVRSEITQESSQLKSFVELGSDLSKSGILANAQSLLDTTKEVSEDFSRLESNVNKSFDSIQSCVQQLADFRSRSGSLLRWLQTVQEQLPAKEPNLSTESLQRRAQQLKDLLTEWETQGSQVQELNKTSSQLENLIINITSPKNKTGVSQLNGASSPNSVNGIHTCKDLTEIQVAVADVNCKYEQLGSDMRERKGKQEASLDLRQKARQSTEALIQWLSPREQSLAQGQTASPSRPEAVRAQAQETKVLLTELADHSGKVEDLKNLLNQLITDNPDSPDAETWKRQLEDIDSRWTKANQTAAHRQTELEACADRLGSFAAAASQLGPWLREKELMMSVLGPLSIDPNMLNTQKQQVQFMLREFETRQPQFDQLSRAAEGILSPSGDEGSRDGQDLEEVRQELADISQQWEGLTSRLTGRSQQIDQAQGTSERYLALLRELSQSVTDLSERLDAQASLSAQPDALRRRLQETGEIRAELEQRRGQLAQAEQLCAELSTIVAELYLRDELHKRLESVSGPLKNLEERAADGLSQLQAALSSTQQFQQMFDELRSWLDGQAGNHTAGASEALPCQPDALKSLLAQQEDLQRAIAQQRGSYELIQAEGASLLASLPAGDERLALQTRLNILRQDWEGMNQQTSNKHSRIKETLSRAELYQQHRNELVPWVAECEEREAEIHPSLDPATLDEALQKARQLSLDLDRRRPLLESLNTAADQLLEQSCTGEEEVRDEKAQLNRRIDGLSERLQGRTAQLEELGSRLKEFEDGRLAVERRLEAAKHQIEVQEALGPQACSNKSLERLRSQQELLNSVQPQVVYLRNLAQGLLQDAPEISRAGEDGGQRLLQQARDTEKEFEEVTEKTEQCCSSLESRLQGVGEVQSRVRDVFSRLADLDDELDSLSPVGRDADSLASQADAVRGFLSRLDALRAELESHSGECTTMLRREGSSPDLLALRRETEALSRQAGKLAERGQNRLALIEAAEERVKEFYGRLADLQGLLGRAEEALNTQAVVGTEVEVIKQQLQEFKAVEREQIDSIQPKLQHVNAVGQGLIQSAAKHTDTQALEHDLETTNLCWNSLNKRVAERIAQLQEALLHCGKFQDALEPLLSWLSDTEELIANQKPPSVEYRVVKAQIQEQKLLQRLLDDRRGTVEMIRAEGERIAATAETQDRDKIQKQLKSLGERWTNLLEKASARQQQLEELQVLALQFHEAVEPLGEWLSATERRLSSAEPMGTQTSKITQQIVRHKALQEEVSSRENGVNHLETLSQSLHPLSCAADRDWLGERVAAVRNGHTELRDWCSRREVMLEQALANAQLFGEEEVEVLNWLAEVAQRLAEVSVQSYQPELLEQQHKHTLALNEEIISRKKTVDQAIKNGQALLKQTTGEEVLLIQEKLDGIKSRYAEMTAGSSKALRTLEQALQLATRFASSHDDISQWLDSVEAELNNIESDTTPAYQDRQRELKCVSAEKRLVLDTVNEVGSALLDLVPWRAREGLDRLVADANQRYRQAEETITQRVQLVQAAIQRSQQYEEAVDAELAWVGETERKLASLGPLSLEPDVTVAQLQVQRAFNIDIIRHKDTVDQLLKTQEEILESCSEQQREALKVKTDSLSARYEAVNQSHAERFSALEQAQVLVARFWETYEELEPWLGETETLITQLPPPAIDTEALRQQQDQMRLLRESIAEHKPHIDKMLKIGPQLAELSAQEGATVRQRYNEAERRYLGIKEEVKGRATALDEAVSQSVQFHDKMDPLLETLEGAVQRLRQPPPVAAEVEKIREQLAEHRATGLELDKLLPSFSALCARGEELISRAPHDDPAAQAVHSRLLRLRSLWDEIRQRAEEREGKLQDVLDLAGKFWADMAALLSTLRDSQDIVKDLEDPGVDPSLIKQQIEAAEAIKAETDGLREELEIVQTLGADLIFACGETEKPEVKKTIDEMNAAWEGLNRTWRERMERLEEAMTASVQYQDALQGMFDYLDNAVIKLCDMPAVGTDLSTVKQQIEELKQYKVEVYQQQIDMEKLSHQGELLLRKVSDQTDRDMIQEPLTELRHLWDNLVDKITIRQHKLEGALLALGQFQHALSELQSWLSHTHATLDTQRPISSDPKAIEIELAKHHVLRNDVLSHRATVETVNSAGSELLESSPGDEINHLRDQLDELNHSWKNLLLKTDERQKLLEAALQQAEGFHGELEEFLQWLRRTESQLSAAKPTGGLPETAREQLQQHMELQAQLTQRSEQYHRLLDQGESNLLARGGEDAGPGTTQTQQNLAMLQNKWASLNAKMDDRNGKLEEAVSLATGFQTSLQDTINWLTQSEQTLNMAQPPSLILDTVLFQIDEHKVFVNEVNTHREQVLALEKAGSQLRFASLKQDVVLIKNLLLSVQARWDKLVQRSLDRGRHLDEARKRAKQFHEAWRKLTDWLEEAESRLDSELEISNEPDKIKIQLAKHKEFQKSLGSKQPVYDTTVRSGKAMRDKATLSADTQKLDNLLGEVRDKWDTVCGKSVERQHKLEEALLFSGQFAEALQALVDWLYRVEPQLAEDQPVHGDLDLVSNLMDSHKVFQKELGKRTSSVQALKRSARELMETGRDDTAWVKVQVQELSNRWETVCALSVSKQTRLQQALKQAEEFRTAVQMLLEWLSEAEQTLRFRGILPEEAETLQALLHTHRDFMQTVEEKRVDVNKAAGMGEAILAVCHPDCITTIKHWITIIRARFEEVLTWAKQHEQRLETALTELLNNATLLEELLSWLQWAETTLVQRDTEPLPQDITQLKTLISEHQMFMEEMTRKQPDVDKVTKTYKRKPAEHPSSLSDRRGSRKHQQQQQHSVQVTSGNPRLTQLCSRWQQVWLLALDRQRKLNDALDRLEELKEFANFDFDVWRKKYMRWMNHKKSRVMDFFRRIDKDQDGKITRQEFIDGILASKFPTSKLEMTAVADIFDRDCDGYIDYYEFVAALHPNKDAYRPTTDADKIEDEVTRQVAQCKCAKRFQVEQIGENKYRFFLGNQFGDSQQLRLVRILRSTVMVRVGGGWMALDEFLVKNDPCRARGRTNLELREKFILPEGATQGLAAFRSRGRRSKPSSRTASPTRSSSSASHSAHSCASLPSAPATPTASSRSSQSQSRGYAKPWLAHSKTPTPTKCQSCPEHSQTPGHEGGSTSKLKRPTFHSSRGSLTGENGGTPTAAKPGRSDTKRTPSSTSGPASRAGSRAGSRASSRRGSDASDTSELMETRSACSDTSDTPRRPGAKPSKIPTISKKAPSPKTPAGKK
uniref:Microtubule actin crosslinking factor 1 n=1 Tax=Cyprinus carpio TaxID=7962 RepID=A0A8C1M204_CYPCA